MGSGLTNAQKKRKRQSDVTPLSNGNSNEAHSLPPPTTVDTSKPTAVFQPTNGRNWTVSVALPGSIVANCQSLDLRTSMAGTIARALAIFCVDEVIVFSDGNTPSPKSNNAQSQHQETGKTDPDHFLAYLLDYLETPPHLRRTLFPFHPNLSKQGILPSLDLPHHLRSDEWCPYREGVTLPGADENGTFVEAGLRIPVTVDGQIPENNRLTLKFLPGAEEAHMDTSIKEIRAEPVAPDEPREEGGYYWGYNVRRAAGLSDVFTECTYEGGYDMTIGTSERGADIETLYSEEDDQKVEGFKHLLVVIGGVAGLEVAVKNDKALQKLGVVEAKDVFDRWINVCPGQGSRTIRTEEAVLMTLMGLRRVVVNNK